MLTHILVSCMPVGHALGTFDYVSIIGTFTMILLYDVLHFAVQSPPLIKNLLIKNFRLQRTCSPGHVANHSKFTTYNKLISFFKELFSVLCAAFVHDMNVHDIKKPIEMVYYVICSLFCYKELRL